MDKDIEVRYLTIDDLENKNGKGVLVLDSGYFQIIKITLEKDLEEREREFAIEEQLESWVIDYDPMEYIEKEISLYETTEEEEIAIILLKRGALFNLLEKSSKNRVEIFGIVPDFLLGLVVEKEKELEVFIYRDKEKYVGVLYQDGELTEILSLEEEEYKGAEEFLNKLTFDEIEKVERIHFLERDRELEDEYSSYGEILIESLEEFSFDFDETFSFLPQEYKEGKKRKKQIKLIGIALLIILIVEFGIGFVFNRIEDRSIKDIALLQKNIGVYNEKIDNKKESIKELVDFEERSKLLMEKMGFNNIKLNKLLEEFESCCTDKIRYSLLEYDGEKILKVVGEGVEEKEIIELEKKILQQPSFTYLNHDYIKKGESSYLFQINIGVKDENN